MSITFNPEMLVLAREVRGITQTELANLTEIPQGNISMYESGLRDIRENHLHAIAQALDFPERFFYREGKVRAVESASVFHRKRQSILKSSLSVLDHSVNLLRLDMEILFRVSDTEFPLSIPQYRPEEFSNDIEHIASLVRAAWDIPPGPIRNLVGYMEAAGTAILLMSFRTDKMDAVSQWKEFSPPVILVSDGISGERQRFSLAHELGHLVMHRNVEPYEKMENEADQFASALLMPADTIALELPPVTVQHMLQIKPSWKVSVQALIRRARDLGIITERRYTSLFQELSRMNYRTIEPFPLPAEQPKLITSVIEFLQNELHYTVSDIAYLLSYHEHDLDQRYLHKRLGLRLVSKGSRGNASH